MALHGMEVTVKKDALLARIETHLGTHRVKYAELFEDWRVKRLDELNGFVADLQDKTPKTHDQHTKLQQPKDYSGDYAAAMEMVKAHEGETLVLTHEQFNLLWLDRHEWHEDFRRVSTSNSSYNRR